MKVKHYIYSDNRKDNTELKEWFSGVFEDPTAIEVEITSDTITLQAIEGPIEIQYVEVSKPKVFEGHTFELLLDYHVEYTIGDKIFSGKEVDEAWNKKRIAEVAVVHYATAMTKVSKAPKSSVEKSKALEERALLKALKAKAKAKNVVETPETPEI